MLGVPRKLSKGLTNKDLRNTGRYVSPGIS
jgi:hypothetical protein